MLLREELEKQGSWLFGRRSYFLLFSIPLLLFAFTDSSNSKLTDGGVGGQLYNYACIVLSFLGLAIRCVTVAHLPKRTSGRSTTEQIAESLNTTGMYSIHRHPLYFGNFIIYLGMILSVQVWWFTAIMVLVVFFYLERIMLAEERFLLEKFGAPYIEWAKVTPAYWPRFQIWRQDSLPFSMRNVLKREYSGFFAIIVDYTVFEILRNVVHGSLSLGVGWLVFLNIGLLIYVFLRTLRKRGFLDVKGR